MGLSNRAFAKLAGVSEGAVRKAKADRIKGAILADGTIDPDAALKLWGKNTDPSMQRKTPQTAAVDDVPAPPPGKAATGPDVSIARTMLIVEKAKREQIKRKREEGSTLERAPTVSAVQTLAREFRDSLMGFPDMHYAQMASELLVDPVTMQVDPHSMYEVLSAHLRKHLEKSIDKIKVEVGK